MRSPHTHWHWYKHSRLSARKRLKYKLYIIHRLRKHCFSTTQCEILSSIPQAGRVYHSQAEVTVYINLIALVL